jgi:hypothetical protein
MISFSSSSWNSSTKIGDMMDNPLTIFIFIFAFIGLGILLSMTGEVLYSAWEDWKNNAGR